MGRYLYRTVHYIYNCDVNSITKDLLKGGFMRAIAVAWAVIAFLVVVLVTFLSSLVFAQTNKVTFAWDANTEEDLKGYRLYTSQNADMSDKEFVTEITSSDDNVIPTQVAVDIPANTYVALTAFDQNGNESELSNVVHYETDAPAPPVNIKVLIEIKVTP